jgi:hypothetical protein
MHDMAVVDDSDTAEIRDRNESTVDGWARWIVIAAHATVRREEKV